MEDRVSPGGRAGPSERDGSVMSRSSVEGRPSENGLGTVCTWGDGPEVVFLSSP